MDNFCELVNYTHFAPSFVSFTIVMGSPFVLVVVLTQKIITTSSKAALQCAHNSKRYPGNNFRRKDQDWLGMKDE